MTDYEICYSYRNAKCQEQQIQVLADLNATEKTQIIAVLIKNGEEIPGKITKRLYKRLDTLEKQIREREREYREIAAALKGVRAE